MGNRINILHSIATGKINEVDTGAGKTGEVKKGFWLGRNISVEIGAKGTKKESLNRGSLIEFLNEKIKNDLALQGEILKSGNSELLNGLNKSWSCFGGSTDDDIQLIFNMVKDQIKPQAASQAKAAATTTTTTTTVKKPPTPATKLPSKVTTATPENIKKIVLTNNVLPIGMSLVCFYKTGYTEFLGNFAICPNGIHISDKEFRGHKFQCAEGAFQWAKYDFCAGEYEEKLNKAIKDPKQFKEKGGNLAKLAELAKFREKLDKFFDCNGEDAFKLNKNLRENYSEVYSKRWDDVRDERMETILKAKFEQNPGFMDLLKATGDSYLLEHNETTTRDDYWSDNHDGSGKNRLGTMLMEIRDKALEKTILPLAFEEENIIRACAEYANTRLQYEIFR